MKRMIFVFALIATLLIALLVHVSRIPSGNGQSAVASHHIAVSAN